MTYLTMFLPFAFNKANTQRKKTQTVQKCLLTNLENSDCPIWRFLNVKQYIENCKLKQMKIKQRKSSPEEVHAVQFYIKLEKKLQ